MEDKRTTKTLQILNEDESRKLRTNDKSWLCNCESCRYWRKQNKKKK